MPEKSVFKVGDRVIWRNEGKERKGTITRIVTGAVYPIAVRFEPDSTLEDYWFTIDGRRYVTGEVRLFLAKQKTKKSKGTPMKIRFKVGDRVYVSKGRRYKGTIVSINSQDDYPISVTFDDIRVYLFCDDVFTADGKRRPSDSAPILKKLKPKAGLTVYVNMYPRGPRGAFKTKREADYHAGSKRISCLLMGVIDSV